jgi:hypothetical protein
MEHTLFCKHLSGVLHAVYVSQYAVSLLLIHRCSRGRS